jgi:hypothetical protein
VKRTHRIDTVTIRLSAREKTEIVETARKSGMTLTGFIRSRCLGVVERQPEADVIGFFLARLGRAIEREFSPHEKKQPRRSP